MRPHIFVGVFKGRIASLGGEGFQDSPPGSPRLLDQVPEATGKHAACALSVLVVGNQLSVHGAGRYVLHAHTLSSPDAHITIFFLSHWDSLASPCGNRSSTQVVMDMHNCIRNWTGVGPDPQERFLYCFRAMRTPITYLNHYGSQNPPNPSYQVRCLDH